MQNLIGVFMTVAMAATNPLLKDWTGEYGGVPPFDKVKIGDIKSGLLQGMEISEKNWDKIANNPEPATFENTIAAMENADNDRNNVLTIYHIWSSGKKTPEFKEIEKEMSPKLAAHSTRMVQNGKLFKRIEDVYNSKEKTKLTPEQQRLTWWYHNYFVQRGAKLSDEQKKRVAEINQELAKLTTNFEQNVLGDEEDNGLVIEKASDLAGLPTSFIESAAQEATNRGLKGKWMIANTRSSMEPFLTMADNRKLREEAFKRWSSRGDAGKHNNGKIITEILKLRAERSKIYGYKTYAHWKLNDSMAKDPNKAMDLMMKVWDPAVKAVKKDVAEMQKIASKDGDFKIQPWDYRYYAEKVRKAKYDLDFNLVKPYLSLENMRKAMFFSAQKLYGLDFIKVDNVPVFDKNMTVYKVVDKDKNFVGLWYFDPFARPGKHSGAWMNDYRPQRKDRGRDEKTFVSNNCNFIPGKPGEPVLISWTDATTLFHEFGHALHGLLSNVKYPSLSGTNVVRDYVEFPSQFNEHYIRTPEVLKFFVDKDGKQIPKDLVDKIEKAKTFNTGFETVEFLASAILDMKLHLAGDKEIDPAKFEKEALKEIGMPPEIIMRHRLPHFGHIFSGDGYAAGYYSYLWSQVLDNDAFEAFTETKSGAYDPETAKRLVKECLSVGNTVDPAEAYRKFRGRDPKPDALLRERGFN
jgi:peptidyl-dipeptidase Dcp